MSGFLHIFDRQQILAGKRVYSTKRLPSSPTMAVSPESVKSGQSTPVRETEKPKLKPATVQAPVPAPAVVPESPERFQRSPAANVFPATTPPRSPSPLPLPIFEIKEGSMKSSWKFCKEMPRLSLDSRATVDSKGSLCAREIRLETGSDSDQRRSPSVIARLMGLEKLPLSESSPVKKPELRRSASESRVSRELFHSKFTDNNISNKNSNSNNNSHSHNANNYLISKSNQSGDTNLINNNNVRVRHVRDNVETMKYTARNYQKNEGVKPSQWRSPQQRRSFFDSGDVFPEPKQTTVPVYGDSDNIFKLRGIDEQSKDLETLKHILEALQFKGLLHSNKPVNIHDDANIVLMKPWRSPAPNRRFGYSGEISPSASPRKDRGVVDRSGRSPVRARNSPANTIVKRKPLHIETERKFHESSESRRNSPINSPKLTPKRGGSDHNSGTNRSPRRGYSNQKVTRNIVVEDESSSFSESSGSTTSHSDPERSKIEDNGKSLLARCDKLLHSIAEMNSINTESHTTFNSVIPSPVSVLDSAFDKDESSSPSPVMKRTIDFKDVTVDLEDDIWQTIIPHVSSTIDHDSTFTSNDSDFKYISEILRASKYLPDDSTVFSYLEKQNNVPSKGSKIQRKLLFDVVAEIIDRNGEQPPWRGNGIHTIKDIWIEFQMIREPETAENLLELISLLMKKDLEGNNGWSEQTVEVAEAVLYIERLIFKDLVCETIRDLADVSGKTMTLFAPRRKLFF
ncbi:hypothetical protein QVD17_17190 [Tagetes erecta]|uniref:DUF4378 domain-containing protein n=1 Tax=Tagetes erecta TaxID=13708 RepID=A0AAD8P180_TARER|nr:hypothetical protein QVD17_17190 [Tagetes erecta]